jgi:putative NADPH-quinone reductase
MRVSIILAHPDPRSFIHAIAQAALAKLVQHKHQVILHDLYAEKFDPILLTDEIPKGAFVPPEVDAHCQEISQAEGIIIIHPNWWGQPPAILKGWIDRVIRPDVAYQFLEGDQGDGIPAGLLKARVALIFNTSNTPTEREVRVFGDPLETLWKNCVFGLCGVEVIQREMFNVIVTSTLEQRQAWLTKVRKTVGRYFPNEG